MGDLEKFLHDQPVRTPLLLKAALSHVQFETIHPFLDGNGRLGRLLITFLLCTEGALSEPLLYLSLYFKEHRNTYYDLLQRVRIEGDWEAWVAFFLEGVIATAEQAVKTAQRITSLFIHDRTRIEKMGQAAGNASRVHSYLQKKPVLEIPRASTEIGISQPTVTTALKRLEEIGVVKEITGKARDRIYVYKEYLDILGEGTQPL
jgi:Fic family protein